MAVVDELPPGTEPIGEYEEPNVFEQISETINSSTNAIDNPTAAASSCLESKEEDEEGEADPKSAFNAETSKVLDLYESHKDTVNSTLGVPDAATDFLGDFQEQGITSLEGPISRTIKDNFSSQIDGAKDIADTTNKLATASSSATQALACFNIDMPEVTELVNGLWDTVGKYASKACAYMGECFTSAKEWLTAQGDGTDWSQFDPTQWEWCQKLHEKAKAYYGALVEMGKKVKNYVQSTAIYKKAVELAKEAVDLVHQCMGAVSAALACAPAVMQALGDGASVVAKYDPTALQAINKVNSSRKNALDEAKATMNLDVTDNAAVNKHLKDKTGDIFKEAKKSVFASSPAKAATDLATAERTNFTGFLDGLDSSFSISI